MDVPFLSYDELKAIAARTLSDSSYADRFPVTIEIVGRAMATLSKKTTTRPMPAGAKIASRTVKGETKQFSDLSFGDVPFIKLRRSNEKSRKGSTIALRSDLAADLREWIKGRNRFDTVFNVPAGILRIMNRDLTAAGIDKTDADGCVIHVHTLRHSFGTHLSRAGVAPRVAQAAMRHSDIALTMNTYTDARLLDTAEAVEALPIARDGAPRTVAPMVAPNLVQPTQIESIPDHSAGDDQGTQETEKARKTLGFVGFDAVGATRFELATSTSRT